MDTKTESTTTVVQSQDMLVLVVEDNAFFRKMEAMLLERAGFQVVTAEGAPEALAIFSQLGSRIAAVVTDLLMPGMNGLELSRLLQEQRSNLPVILVTGSEGEECLTDPTRHGLTAAFQKPINPKELIESLCAAFAAAAPAHNGIQAVG